MTEYVPGPHSTRTRRRLWPYIAILAVVAAAAAVFIWPRVKGDKSDTPAAAAGVTTFNVNGTLALGPGQFVPVDGTSCAGTPTYKDLTEGTAITVTDGAVLGAGRLGAMTLDGLGSAGTCDLKFSVPGIPIGKGTYGVEVAHRGATKYDEAKVRSGPLQLFVN
jgi:hypothetical protein